MSDIKKFMDIMMETTAGATSSGSVATVAQPMMATERRVNPSVYANQSSTPAKMDDHCPECKCNPCACHEESRKAPTAPKAKEFGLWQNSVLAGKAQKEKKAKKATNESVKILKTTKTPTGKQVQGNYGLDYQPEEKLDMYGHSMRGSPNLHSPRIPDNKYPGQGPGRPENTSSTDAFDVLKKDPFGRDNDITEDDLEEDWEGIKNAGKKAIGAGAIGLAALGGGAQAQTAPANTGTNVAQTQSVSSNAAIVKSLVNPEARQRFLKQHSDTTSKLSDPKYDHNPDALAQHENYPKEQHSQWIQNVRNAAEFDNPYQIISIALNKAGLTPQEVLQNLPKGYKLPAKEPKETYVPKGTPTNVNERDIGSGQRKLKLAEVDKDNKKSIGPNKNDPYEKGWRARYNDSNPYSKGTKEHNEWQHGNDEREAQPNHYDESVKKGSKNAAGIGTNEQGVTEGEGMSRAAKGYEKYGRAGMAALAKAGREGRALDKIRDKYNKYDDSIEEACWKGYHKEGMKTMFGKEYPNCKKNKNESLETYVRKGECPGCGGAMVSEGQLNEKQDACYHKVKSRYKIWPSAYASGALVQCRKKGAANWGNSNESIAEEEYDDLDESLHDWFAKEKWVRVDTKGKIKGPCARGSESEGKPKCLPQKKAHSMGKEERASAAARKRKKDPNPDRSGKAINVKTEGMSAKIKPIQELSSATLDRYKEKAKKSSDELTRQGKYRKANDRTMNVMKATGKQIDNTVSSIRKSLRNDKSVAEGSNTKVTKTSSDIRAINKAAMKEISSLKKSKQ